MCSLRESICEDQQIFSVQQKMQLLRKDKGRTCPFRSGIYLQLRIPGRQGYQRSSQYPRGRAADPSECIAGGSVDILRAAVNKNCPFPGKRTGGRPGIACECSVYKDCRTGSPHFLAQRKWWEYVTQSGLCVVCPVVENTAADALHIRVKADSFVGIAMCEQLKTMDLKNRYFRKKGSLSYGMIQEITDAVQSIFDYYPYE